MWRESCITVKVVRDYASYTVPMTGSSGHLQELPWLVKIAPQKKTSIICKHSHLYYILYICHSLAFTTPTTLSISLYLWYNWRDSGFATVPLGCRFDPETICLTAISIFLPFTVYWDKMLTLTCIARAWKTNGDIRNLKNVWWDMSSAESLSDGSFDICHQLGSEFVSRTHFQEEKNTLVFVLGTALSNA